MATILIVILAAVIIVCSFPTVTFIEGPSDVYVAVGESAYFNCTYNGTQDLPIIVINGNYKTLNDLPPRHRFEFMRLIITDVQPSDNNSRYQCSFPGSSSSVGRIFIVPATTELEEMILFTSELSLTTSETTAAESASENTTDILLLPTLCVHCNDRETSNRVMLLSMVILTTFLLVGLTTTTVVIACYCYRNKRRTKVSGTPKTEDEPYYATIDNVSPKDTKDDISVFANQAYSQIGMSTVQNEAYALLDSKCTDSSSAYAEIPDMVTRAIKKSTSGIAEKVSCRKVESVANS